MDWSGNWLAALGMVLVIEGLLPLLSPAGWRRMFMQVLRLRDGQIRFCAFLSLLAGVCMLALLA
ncbi:DUF2065 domain-containing protein [Melaminivora sp.]|uniref:DUF2065 domain-containing protein n=1 Tax=Melaminivora sp. TaxID=1933032 RepID=UPI0028ACAA0D|nr:DUF2065 domain-containing protein [Melaminivora sp.]